jgi:hypothetical protein
LLGESAFELDQLVLLLSHFLLNSWHLFFAICDCIWFWSLPLSLSLKFKPLNLLLQLRNIVIVFPILHEKVSNCTLILPSLALQSLLQLWNWIFKHTQGIIGTLNNKLLIFQIELHINKFSLLFIDFIPKFLNFFLWKNLTDWSRFVPWCFQLDCQSP